MEHLCGKAAALAPALLASKCHREGFLFTSACLRAAESTARWKPQGPLRFCCQDLLAPAPPQEQGGAGVFTNSCPLFPSPSLRPRSPRIAGEVGGGPGRGGPRRLPPAPSPQPSSFAASAPAAGSVGWLGLGELGLGRPSPGLGGGWTSRSRPPPRPFPAAGRGRGRVWAVFFLSCSAPPRK